MNKKNKNKNKQNKVPNPTPPQKVEENVEVKEIKEERVPEITPVTEIVDGPIVGGLEQPKKPKRNRGKKKLEDATEKTEDGKNDLPEPEERKDPEKEVKTEQTKVLQEVISEEQSAKDCEVITPSSRKKKNKNKKSIENVITEIASDKKEDMLVPKNAEANDNVKEMQIAEIAHDEVVTPGSDILEPSQNKKRNKNKKNKKGKIDSEFVEKISEVVEQSIIKEPIIESVSVKEVEPPENKPKGLAEQIKEKREETLSEVLVPLKAQETVENKNVAREDIKVPSDTQLKAVQKSNIKSSDIEQIKIVQLDSEIPEIIQPELKDDNKNEQSKSKRKNKKKRTESEHSEGATDTKQPIELNIETENIMISSRDLSKEEEVVIVKEKSNIVETTQNTIKNKYTKDQVLHNVEKITDVQQKNENIDNKNLQELPKVDRTRKEKSKSHKGGKREECKLVETLQKNVAQIAQEEIPRDLPKTNPPLKENISQKDEASSQKDVKVEPLNIDVHQIHDIHPPEEIPKQQKDIGDTFAENIHSCPMRTDKVKTSKQTIEVDTIEEQMKLQVSEQKESPMLKPEETSFTLQECKIKHDVIEQIDKPLDKVDAITNLKEDIHKSKKKNKKDKKQAHISDTIAPITEETEKFELTEEIQEMKDEEKREGLHDKKELPHLTLLSTNVSAQSTISDNANVRDFSPDSIEFPRSISQQGLSDSNNNIVIEELLAETQNLNVPIQIPDTPFNKSVPNPDIISGINVQVDTPPATQPAKSMETKIYVEDNKAKSDFDMMISFAPKPPVRQMPKMKTENVMEKTDLKSKVMEVNQDMEDLRLSIERSLAELTALEKCDEIPELVSLTEVNTPDVGKELISKQVSDIKVELPTTLDDKLQEPVSLKALLGIGKAGSEKEDNKCLSSEVLHEPTRLNPDAPEPKKGKGKIKFEPALQSKLEDIKPLYLPDFSQIIVPSQAITEFATPKGEEFKDTCHEIPSCPIRKDKGKGKSKKKGKHEEQTTTGATTQISSTSTADVTIQKDNKDQKEQKKDESTKDQKKEQKDDEDKFCEEDNKKSYEPIENFEDAMTSSVDDVNKTFELIADASNTNKNQPSNDRTEPSTSEHKESTEKEKGDDEEEKIDGKENPLVTNPKNLLGHPDIPVPSNKMDYKKEKNRPPNAIKAKVRIKDAPEIELKAKQHKQSQTELPKVVLTRPTNESNEYIYKYSFRKVFLPHGCHICKKALKDVRVACNYCNLLFYCSAKHKDEDWPQHQALCFAISTIVHLKGEKHIYADAKDVTGLNYRLLRMQMIVSCEKILKRRLVPWEQEILLYPRICADASCREWRQGNLKDCEGCGQISYCKENLDHLPKSHNRWCKSYSLYEKLVVYQQTKGRLEPRLPTKVITKSDFKLPDKINELLAHLYEEKIDMDELQYATLTQLATAPLTAAYCHQIFRNKINGTFANGFVKKSTFTIHVVGAELQFEADSLNKWEIFFLHLKPEVKELNVALIGPELNPSNLPLDLLAKIKLCENCVQNKRKVIFNFYDKLSYHEFANCDDFSIPDIVCAFNPSLNRSIGLNDSWKSSINSILKLRSPLCVTSYTPGELPKDLAKISESAAMDVEIMKEPSKNPYASIRPDRNFITDDEQPLLFKNYSYMIVSGMF